MTTEHQDAQPALPELPEPDWYAVDTPGADSDVTITKDAAEALELSGDGLPDFSKITSFYAGGHVREIVRAALVAQQAAEPVAWLSVDSIGERYLCFSRPNDNDAVTPLYTHAPATPQTEPVIIERKVYKNSPEHSGYLSARFAPPRSISFEWDGHRWAYQHTSFDDTGEFDLIWRPATTPPQAVQPQGEPSDEQIDRVADEFEDECGRIRVDKVFAFARAVLALRPSPAPAFADEAARLLKSALNGLLTFFGMDEDENSKPVFDKARKAMTVEFAPYTTIDMGHGKWEVGAGTNADLPCIAFGRNGSGKVGELITLEPRQMSVEETFAVITFANVEGLEVLQEKVNEVRERFFQAAPAVTEGERDRLIDEELKKRGYPANTRNAARAGWYAALASRAVRVPMSEAARDVLAERERQISIEGWTPEHDDQHSGGSMAVAAACYAMFNTEPVPSFWPWASKWWKPTLDHRRNLVRAGALILAEIERLDRAHGITQPQGQEGGVK